MNALLQELSTEEIQEYVSQLERALENHAAWLGKVNETLICHLTPRPEDLSEAPTTTASSGSGTTIFRTPY